MSTKKTWFAAIAVALATGFGMAIVAEAQQVPANAAEMVAQRRAAMAANGRAIFQTVTPMMRAENTQPWNQQAAQQAASDVLEAVRLIRVSFPAGTAGSPTLRSRALPAIWERNQDFQNFISQLEQGATGMRAAAMANDQAAFRAAFQAVNNACNGCHQNFRGPALPPQ